MTTDLLQDSLVHPFKSRVERREIRVGIIGLGYVGLPLALLYIDQRIPVTGFDIDQQKVDTLMTAGTYIFRIRSSGVCRSKVQRECDEEESDANCNNGRRAEREDPQRLNHAAWLGRRLLSGSETPSMAEFWCATKKSCTLKR